MQQSSEPESLYESLREPRLRAVAAPTAAHGQPLRRLRIAADAILLGWPLCFLGGIVVDRLWLLALRFGGPEVHSIWQLGAGGR